MLVTKPPFFDGETVQRGPRVLNDLLRRVVLEDALDALEKASIPVMLLKGALLAYWVYNDSAARQVGDVDLLVPEGAFPEAIKALASKGYYPDRPIHTHERTLRAHGIPLTIDLHRALFPKYRYRLSARDLFRRGSRDRRIFGFSVILPDPYDVCAHLVGHAAAAHQMPLDSRTISDIELISQKFGLSAEHCASHLERTGLARAARYVLGQANAQTDFAGQILEELRPDSVGQALADAELTLSKHFSADSIPARIGGHLTNATLGMVAAAALIAIADRICSWQESE